MNAQFSTNTANLFNADKVTGWNPAQIRAKKYKGVLNGYALTGPNGMLGFIETIRPLPRLEELLTRYTLPPVYLTARELMRDLLTVEDYRSEVYDVIVRIHYTEDFANV